MGNKCISWFTLCYSVHKRAPLCGQRRPHKVKRLYGATSAAWRIFTPAARVAIKRRRSGLAVKRYAVTVWLQAGALSGRIVFDNVARVYTRAGPATPAGIFCCHCLNHAVTPIEITRRAYPAAWSAMTISLAVLLVPAQSIQLTHVVLRPPSTLAGHAISPACLSTPTDTRKTRMPYKFACAASSILSADAMTSGDQAAWSNRVSCHWCE